MNTINLSTLLLIYIILTVNSLTFNNMTQKDNSVKKPSGTEWIISDFVENPGKGITIQGNPEIIKYKNKKAVSFNGTDDAIFLDEMPLTGLGQFTVEMIFNPYSGGNFEQRFLHCGEINGDRLLLELRSKPEGWYFDAFIKIKDQGTTLIEPTLLHPSDQWYHVAYVIDNGKLETYVNGKKELEGTVAMSPVNSGQTSIGVRQNKVSWFRGAIYKIRITPEVVRPGKFMSL
ncbi:MAG TPA: laminin G [Bacteroidales bacterium]|nr:laminin G [Bacteroidales bacterium]